MKRNLRYIIITLLLVLNMCITGVIGYQLIQLKNQRADETVQYVMYVGTNDKDTYTLEITVEEAREIIDKICLRYLEGYTIQEAVGSWVDEKGVPTHENTIVCYFDGADEKTIYQIADEIIKALNQNTVLIEKASIKTDFYSGR